MSGQVHMVSLGCPKNRVDSEVMLGHVLQEGYEITDVASEAEVIVVNTCGFLQAALEESVDTILEMATWKEQGRCRQLVVTGCAVERHADALAKEIPEVDHFLGVARFARLPEVLKTPSPRLDIGPTEAFLYDHQTPRINTVAHYSAYVKISEGCDNKCTFCVIPSLRGPQRSRSIEDIVAEVEGLASAGVKEINLVAQDLTAYGYDRGRGQRLTELLRALGGVDGIRWIRLFYAYPRIFPDRLVEAIADEEKVVPYLDMPLQHISETMLRRMRRGHRAEKVRRLLDKLRQRIPGLVMRTTMIVGFPGESEADFDELLAFVEAQRFERLGVFRFSREPGTPAADLADQVPAAVKNRRYRRLMDAQKKISAEQSGALVGRRLEVLVEGPSQETDLLLQGRTAVQAPDIDGVVLINEGYAAPGEFVEVEIGEAHDYDLVGRIVTAPGPINLQLGRLDPSSFASTSSTSER